MATNLVASYRAPAVCSHIRIRRGGLNALGAFTRLRTGARRVALVSDARVAALHGRAARAALRHAGIDARLVLVPRGERAKSPRELARLWDRLAREALGRRDAIVALGGGVVGDLSGFTAATWLRGIPWVCVPSTLLAQVDSSVGGKTAINLDRGKNLPGAFHQPAGVLVDPDLLATLPRRALRAGLAEVVKMGMAVEGSLFRWTERHAARLLAGDPRALESVVTRAIRAKLRIVRRDEREREGGPRTALNYGHTLGHALESACGYRRIHHGEAVALGMRAAGAFSERLAGLAPAARARQEALLDALGLPRRMPAVRIERLWRALAQDKKRGAAGIRWVLTPRVGHASVPRPIERRLVQAVLIQLGARV